MEIALDISDTVTVLSSVNDFTFVNYHFFLAALLQKIFYSGLDVGILQFTDFVNITIPLNNPLITIDQYYSAFLERQGLFHILIFGFGFVFILVFGDCLGIWQFF